MTAAQWLKEQDLPGLDQELSCGACAYLRKGAGRSLKAGGQWIYDNELDHIEGNAQDGEILRVSDFDGYALGFGFLNSRSKIRVRMLTRYRTDSITPALIRRRVRDAWAYRKAVMGADVSCCRVLFGEADFLPGITVDKFGDVLVIESLALGTDRLKLLILRELAEVLEEDGITLRGIYERSDAKVRQLEGMERVKGFIGPQFDTQVPITENGVRYLVDVEDGQKTGFFLDQKYNRAAVAKIVGNLAGDRRPGLSGTVSCENICRDGRQERGPRVLDCFTHTGSFGLNAAAAGAAEVLSVDASRTAILQAAENAERNGYRRCGSGVEISADSDMAHGDADTAGTVRTDATGSTDSAGADGDFLLTNGAAVIRYRTADVFELLPQLESAGEQFDVVILDPPAFTKSRQATKNAVKGYREINLRGMRLVEDGGYLATCSCSHFMDEELLKKTIREAARGARKRLRQVEFRTQAADHPILWGDDESYYLKFFIFQVVEEI